MTVFNKSASIPKRAKIQGLPSVLTDADLTYLVEGSDDRRYGLVKRALATGDLIQIRRGLYVLGELDRTGPIHSFELAQKIYGPSYVSLESALAYWGLIPEAVYTVTSGCSRRAAEFDTPFGRFAYTRIPCRPLLESVVRQGGGRETAGSAVYLVATPLRAILDYVYVSGQQWSVAALVDSLRLETLPQVDQEEVLRLREGFTSRRVRDFIDEYQNHSRSTG